MQGGGWEVNPPVPLESIVIQRLLLCNIQLASENRNLRTVADVLEKQNQDLRDDAMRDPARITVSLWGEDCIPRG